MSAESVLNIIFKVITITKKTSTTPLLLVGAAVLPRAAGVHLLRPGGVHGVGGQARRHHRQDHAGGHQPFQRSAGDYQVRIVELSKID